MRPSPDGPPVGGPLLAHPLLPGVRPVRRPDGAIQLGADPVHGVIVTGMAPGESDRITQVLEQLALAGRPLEAADLARSVGLPVRRVAEIARLILDAGLTTGSAALTARADEALWALSRRRLGEETPLLSRAPSPLAQRRSGARVVVDGRGALVAEIARLLRAAGVDDVRSGWCAGNGDDLLDAGPDATLVIAVAGSPPEERASDWDRRGIAHLPIIARPASADIGPLVTPGTGPCLRCVGMQQRTTAGARPADGLLGEDTLDGVGSHEGLRPAHAVEPSLAAVVAGTAVMLALGHIDAYPPPVGTRWHTALPLPTLATSSWQVQPRCETPSHRHRAVARSATRQETTGMAPARHGGTLVG